MASYAGNALFGRKYRLIIGKKGESGLDTSALHCSFTVEKSMSSRPNYSTLKIYNLAPDTQNSILSEGSRIIIEAGYEGPQYGLIYDGDIVQTLCYVEDGISSVTEILSQDGDVFLNKGFISVSYSSGETASSLFSGLAGQGDPDMELGEISSSLSGTKLARGKAMFGKPGDYAQRIARGQGGLFFINDRKVNLVRPEDLPTGEIVNLSPDSGLIGAPEQTENGIKAKCLLNPLLNLNKLVYIDNSLVKQQARSVGQAASQPLGTGVYRIITLTHTGDTRGNDWYTDFTGIAQPGLVPQTGKIFTS